MISLTLLVQLDRQFMCGIRFSEHLFATSATSAVMMIRSINVEGDEGAKARPHIPL
jgi:hypothetical protein